MGVLHHRKEVEDAVIELFNSLSFFEKMDLARQIVSEKQSYIFQDKVVDLAADYSQGLRDRYICITFCFFNQKQRIRQVRFQPEQFFQIYEAR